MKRPLPDPDPVVMAGMCDRTAAGLAAERDHHPSAQVAHALDGRARAWRAEAARWRDRATAEQEGTNHDR